MWEKVKLGEIFNIARGGSPRPIQDFLTDDNSGINWIMIGDTSNDKYITSTKNRIKPEGLKKSRFVHSGDFLLTNSMSFGRPYILKIDGCIHDGWLVLSPKKVKSLSTDFFYHLLGSNVIKKDLEKMASGAVVKNLNSDIVKNFEIPLPPLHIQEKIAKILDKADELRRKDKELQAKYDQLAQAIFIDMFGDPVKNEKGWEVIKIGELSNVSSGSTPSRGNESFYIGNIPWVKTGEVKGSTILETEENISKEALKSSSCKIYPKGSLIIAMYGQGKTRGQIGILGIQAATNQACAVISPSEKMNYSYLFELLKQNYEDLRSLGRGGNQPNLNIGLIKNYNVINPPIHLQEEFAKKIQIINQLKAQTNTEKSEELFQSLLQKAFKGELVS